MRTALTVLIGLMAAVSGVVLLGWLLWRLWAKDQMEAPAVLEIEVPDAGPPEAPSPPEEADDLKMIEGIGPKISQVLLAADVRTFAQLAAIDIADIQGILSAADPRLGRLADPSTWPDQAALAAEGDWEALKDLQGELRGGRRA